MDIPGIPDSIPRTAVIELVQSLGIDPVNAISVKLNLRSIDAEIYAVDERGHRYAVDDDTIATHTISIPIVDAKT